MFPPVTPGGYAPGPPGRPPAFSRRPAPGRPEPPRRRRGLWAAAALAVVVVLAAVGYFVKNSFSTGAKTTGSAQADVAEAARMHHPDRQGGAAQARREPSGRDRRESVRRRDRPWLRVRVRRRQRPRRDEHVQARSRPGCGAVPRSSTPRERRSPRTGTILVVTGGSGITVFRVSSLEQGAGAAKVGSLVSPGQMHAEDVAITPRRELRVRHLPEQRHVGVFDLQRALSSGFGSAAMSSGTSRWAPSRSGSR